MSTLDPEQAAAHKATVEAEIDHNMRSAIDTFKMAGIVTAIGIVAFTGCEAVAALQGNQDRCSQLRLEADRNNQPASHLSFIADNGVEVRCY
ncbi:MAG: hypothetical protein WBP26_01230 [Candidatus Saccharimonadales bacterium]